ncbi:unnamed protein product [Miscanthus lutarioriparius]|uniref:Uncharacterized protein n=1 Tax=Miscanthus lutarioriparius TaxID=422564 RepID=A0A811MLK0_9POAL|nr:unnamed protein product [Miscanthus lutarioriparius]
MAGQEHRTIDLEEGWAVMQKGITKLKNILEGKPEPQFSSEDYMMLYTLTFRVAMDIFNSRREMMLRRLFFTWMGQIDGNVVKLRFTLQPRQRAASPMKAPPPPPKRDAPQIEKGVSSAEKDAQQRPRESHGDLIVQLMIILYSIAVDYTCLSLLNLATSKAVEEPTKKATTSTSLSSSPTPSLPLQINFSKKGTRASVEAWVQEGYQGAAALEGLLEEEASLVTAEAAVHLPLDASGVRFVLGYLFLGD